MMAQDDGKTEGRVQRYRQAPACLEAAVDHWLQHAADLSFVLTLGDIIDGNVTPAKTGADLERVAGQIDRLVSSMLRSTDRGHPHNIEEPGHVGRSRNCMSCRQAAWLCTMLWATTA